MHVADLEAECIVFATEGLLLARDFIFDCGIRVEANVSRLIRKNRSTYSGPTIEVTIVSLNRNLLIQQSRHIIEHIICLPFLTKIVESTDSPLVDHRRQAGVLHEAA